MGNNGCKFRIWTQDLRILTYKGTQLSMETCSTLDNCVTKPCKYVNDVVININEHMTNTICSMSKYKWTYYLIFSPVFIHHSFVCYICWVEMFATEIIPNFFQVFRKYHTPPGLKFAMATEIRLCFNLTSYEHDENCWYFITDPLYY